MRHIENITHITSSWVSVVQCIDLVMVWGSEESWLGIENFLWKVQTGSWAHLSSNWLMLWGSFPKSKTAELEVDRSYPFSIEVKNH